MRNSKIITAIIFLYFILSGYTQTSGDVGVGIAGRVTYGDFYVVFMFLISIFFIRKIFMPTEYKAFLLFIILSAIAAFVSDNPNQALIELLIHTWLWMGSLLIFNLVANSRPMAVESVLSAFMLSSAVLASFGLMQLFVFPSMFSGQVLGGVVGTFRNTGQAGTYFGIALAVVIPAILAGMIRLNIVTIILTTIILIALIFTLKRAAGIGFIIGYFGLLILMITIGEMKYKKYAFQILLLSILIVPAQLYLFSWGLENVDSMKWRFESKIHEDAATDFASGFFAENVAVAWRAFSDHPLLGAGMGNIAGQYSDKYEIHSTYLKILASGGIFGAVAYVVFMSTWVRGIAKSIGKRSREELFLLYFSPFLFGLLVSWTYTYHLRKREFWIAFAIVTLLGFVVRQKKKRDSVEENERSKRTLV